MYTCNTLRSSGEGYSYEFSCESVRCERAQFLKPRHRFISFDCCLKILHSFCIPRLGLRRRRRGADSGHSGFCAGTTRSRIQFKAKGSPYRAYLKLFVTFFLCRQKAAVKRPTSQQLVCHQDCKSETQNPDLEVII